MSSRELPDYVKVNRDQWTKNNAEYTDGRAEHAWSEKRRMLCMWSMTLAGPTA